jgi:ankyrin repeat protein
MLAILLLGFASLFNENGITKKAHHNEAKSNLTSSHHRQAPIRQNDDKQNKYSYFESITLDGGYKYTPLMRACNLADVEKAKTLISEGAKVNVATENGMTALMLAAMENGIKLNEAHTSSEAYYQTVALLIQHGADTKAADAQNNTVLTYAAWGGNVQIAKMLVAKGAVVTTTSKFGTTMLHAAATSGSVDMIQFFIDKGADINALNSEGCSPIWATTLWISPLEAFNALLNKGADIKVRDKNGETLLMQVCGSVGNTTSARLTQESKAKLLIAKGIDIDAQSDSSLSSLKIDNQLEGYGIDQSMVTSGKTALMFAVREDDLDMIKLLVTAGANVNLSDNKGQTAIIHACRSGNSENVTLLLDSKADPNSVDDVGETALMLATQADNLNLVKALLAKGADTKFRNDNEKTAADYVVPNGAVSKGIGNQLAPDVQEEKPDNQVSTPENGTESPNPSGD